MKTGITHEAETILKDLEQRRKRLNTQINNLKSYEDWRLIKGQTLKSGVSYFSAKRLGNEKKKYEWHLE